MQHPTEYPVNPEFDLVLVRVVDLTPEQIWAAWTQPDLITQWFTPAPWVTAECAMELRPGGRFYTKMVGPNPGEEFAGESCVLEVIPNRRLVWCSALLGGYRPNDFPADGPAFPFTAVISMEPIDGGTRYTAHTIHATAAAKQQHEAMGFQSGWGAAFDQLVELMKRIHSST